MVFGSTDLAAWRSTLYPETGYDPSLGNLETGKVIQDFSYAGYAAGRRRIPDVTRPVYDVTLAPFFADASGATDATDAIQAAINAAGAIPGGGVVWLPAGTYRLSIPIASRSQALLIDKSGVVLRGAGVGRTFLLNTTHVLNTPEHRGAKAVIRVLGPFGAGMAAGGTAQSTFTADVLNSTRLVPVASTSGFAMGQTVSARIDLTDAWIAETKEPDWIGQGVALGGVLGFRRTITAIDAIARTITLDAPIRHPLKLRDGARLVRLGAAPVSEVGLEDFSIGNLQHPGTTWAENAYTDPATAAYAVHDSRLIELTRVRDCWVRRVNTYRPTQNTSTAHLLSNGIRVNASTHVTIADCVFQRPQYGGGGGNGYMFTLYGSQECLIRDSEARFSRHGFDIAALGASGNVITACIDGDTGLAAGATGSYATSGMSSDHHKHLSMANLIDACTADASWFEAIYRPFGGTPTHGITATHSVFWNTLGTGRLSSRMGNTTTFNYAVRSDQAGWGYVIGTRGTRSAVVTTQNASAANGQGGPIDHVEGVGQGDTLEPFSLYADQLLRRIGPSLALPVEVTLPYPADTVDVAPAGFFIGTEPAMASQFTTVWSAASGVTLTPRAGGAIRARVPGAGRWTIIATSVYGTVENTQSVVIVADTPGRATTYSLVAVADTHVRDGSLATTNYGTATSFELKNDNANSTFNRRALLRFDQSSLAGATPLSARLLLSSSATLSTYTGWNLAVHPLASSVWDEAAVNWNTAPAFGPIARTFGVSATRTDVVEVSALYLSLGGTSTSAVNLGLTMQTRPINAALPYASRENADPSLRPRLEIDAFPAEARFENWIAARGAVPVSARGATDDPDGDGVANLLEMVLGGDPARGEAMQPLRYDAGAAVVIFSLSADQPLGVNVRLEASEDLADWVPVALLPEMVAVQADGTRVVTVPVLPIKADRWFWRLRAEVDTGS